MDPERHDELRAHPERATLAEQLVQAQEEIRQLRLSDAVLRSQHSKLREENERLGELLHASDAGVAAAVRASSVHAAADASRTLPCASTWTYLPPSPALQFHTLRSSPLPPAIRSMADLFEVHHCVNGSAAGAAGAVHAFRIRRLVGCPARVRRFSNSSNTTDWASSRFSPDELHLTLEGEELTPCPLTYLGACTSVATCRIGTPGTYHVVAMHLRADYDALDELAPSVWPPAQYDLVLGDECYIDVRLRTRAPTAQQPPALPPCDERACSGRAAHGRWVSTRPARGLPPLLSPPYANVTRRLVAVRPLHVARDEYEWRPWGCALRRATLDDAVRCLRDGRNISELHLYGDSNAALAFEQIVEVLQWPGAAALAHRVHGYRKTTPAYRGLRMVTYNHDAARKTHPAADDVVLVTNFGQHPAASTQPLEGYAAHVRRWVQRTQWWVAAGRNRHAMWMPTPLLPPRVDGFVRGHHDGRTLHRLQAYNEAANEIVAAANITIIDNLAPTLGYTSLQDDAAHYTQRPIFELQPTLVLRQICAALSGVPTTSVAECRE